MFCRIISLIKTTWVYPSFSLRWSFFDGYPTWDCRPIAELLPKIFFVLRELATFIFGVLVTSKTGCRHRTAHQNYHG